MGIELSEEAYLAQYDPNRYLKPAVTVDVLVFYTHAKTKENMVLLVQRKQHPFRNSWAIPGGFVNIDEDLDTAARRELQEETNVTNIKLLQLHTYGEVSRDPRMRVISVVYMAVIHAHPMHMRAGDDAQDAKWFHIYEDDRSILLKSVCGNIKVCYNKQENIYVHDGVSAMLAFDHIMILRDGMRALHEEVYDENDICD